jgi:hypothetical protein
VNRSEQPTLISHQDEKSPICNRCERCGFECGGAKGATFIEGKIVRCRQTEKRMTVLARPDAGERARRGNTDHKATLIAPPRLGDFDVLTYICYARKYLLRGGPVDLALQQLQLRDVIAAGTSMEDDHIFHRSVLSFVIIFFGSQHKRVSITNRGYSIHGVALKQLNQALSEPNCFTRDDIILSVVALALLECFVPTGPKYYLKHIAGLEKLLELRGPSAYCSPNSSELCKGIRRMILFASLSTGNPSILARAEWKAVPVANDSDEEMEERQLFNILADCTVLASDRDKMLTRWNPDLEKDTHQVEELKQKALNMLKDLYAWRKRWDSDGRNSHFETPATFAALQPMHQPWGKASVPLLTIFEFANDFAATMLMFYNTALIHVLNILASMPAESPRIESNRVLTNITLPVAGYSDTLWKDTKDEFIAAERSAALEVCRCIPYHLVRKSSLDSSSLTVAHLAITTAWMTLRGNETPEGRWIEDLLNTRSREVMAKGLWPG